jgi:hypothetical protein
MTTLKQLSNKIASLKGLNEAALRAAIAETGTFAEKTLVDAAYKRYGFKTKSYIAKRVHLEISEEQARVYARYRKSNSRQFMVSPVYRSSRNKRTPGKQVLAGYTVAYLRDKINHFPGAFFFHGKSNNVLMAYRGKGDTTKGIPEVMYGPSVAGAIQQVSDISEPTISQYLEKRYHINL